MIRSSYFFLIFVAVGLYSCDDQQVFDEYQTVSNSWEVDEKIQFTVPKLDSTQVYNLFFNVRNNNEYRFSNLFIISEMNFPNGKTITDTLEYQMCAPDGTWLGAGFSDLKENKLWYKDNVKFTEQGDYTVSIHHAMRKNGEVNGVSSLEGITDIGFRIENVKTP